MPTLNINTTNLPNTQRGIVLIEGLIAILIFSMGILALMGLQAAQISHTNASKHRTDASYLADQIIGEMWAGGNNATLPGYACNPCTIAHANPAIVNWVTQIQANNLLPGTLANPPTIVVNGQQVTVTIFWKVPNEQTIHNYVTVTDITKNT